MGIDVGRKTVPHTYTYILIQYMYDETISHIYIYYILIHYKVNHLKLLETLQEHGVPTQVLNWTHSFLIGRSQTVVLDGDSSAEVPVTSGVPQGSVLGPLCFLIYINKLPSSVSSQIRLFADDTAVYLTINSLSDSQAL